MDKLNFLNNVICETSAYKEMSLCIDNSIFPVLVSGVPSVVRADLIRAVYAQKKKKIIVITDDELYAVKLAKDLSIMGLKAYPYFSKDFNFINALGHSMEYEYKRLYTLMRLADKTYDVIVTSIDSALQYTIPPKTLKKYTFTLKVNDNINIEDLTVKLLQLGYEPFNQVETVGQFSVRGGIVDIFSTSDENPIRLEFWGDTIDTISTFDAETQRRTKSIKKIKIAPCCEVLCGDTKKLAKDIQSLCDGLSDTKEGNRTTSLMKKDIQAITDGLPTSLDKYISLVYKNSATLFDYIDDKNILFEINPVQVNEKLNTIEKQNSIELVSLISDGTLCGGLDRFSEDEIYYNKIKSNKALIYLDDFTRTAFSGSLKKNIAMSATSLPAWNGSLHKLYDDLHDSFNSNSRFVIMAGTEKYAKNIAKTLTNDGFNAYFSKNASTLKNGFITVVPDNLSGSFAYPECNFKLITLASDGSTQKKKKLKDKSVQNISSVTDLKNGDYVVHIAHGIGIFCGIHKMKANGVEKDYIKIQYDRKDVLYIPVTQLDMVSKYIKTGEDSHIKLSSLSSNEWTKKKKKARAMAKDIAKQLTELYAKRINAKGYAFPEDTPAQREFEEYFEFEETDDQLKCIREIKEDMERPIPMDRLLCGDVGVGKTEVALRAMFKCVVDSKQCALLVPTTILAWQHYQTIKRRFEKFPFRIELLSRFKTTKEKNEIIEDIKSGKVDIVVGTHSLISKNVTFRRLGLAIIDEEQRFGVKQKEKFKQLKSNVDILTLSATPIPRTLNMAMSGLRDMSCIEEAPQDRHPVQTFVIEHDDDIILDAIKKELRRGGQVYYLHNKTESIAQVAVALQSVLPDYTVAYAHGQMAEKELAEVWRKMMDHEIDILVCTTIIETGIDVPNANTIIIDNADHMGLSQLHQLRGRVGRSSRRAYAYFTFFPNKLLSDVSERRLSAIQEFTQFGSGFKIATRDLEIRGAGNVLGAEQHGQMEDIGYDLYMKILNEAIQTEKGEILPEQFDFECIVDLPVSAYIPEDYIKDLNSRLEMYKKISLIRSNDDISEIVDELVDRFGDPPACIISLMDIALIRSYAQRHCIHEIRYKDNNIQLYQNSINMELTQELMNKFDGKIIVNAMANPYVGILSKEKNELIPTLKYALSSEVKV